jgi:hypothetical protein
MRLVCHQFPSRLFGSIGNGGNTSRRFVRMKQWIVVVLGVTALCVGASAPTLIIEAIRPGSIAAPDRPSPGDGIGHEPNSAGDRGSQYANHRPSQNQDDPSNDANGGENKSPTDWWFNGGLILVGLLQLWVFGQQAKRLRQSVDLTREVANRQETDMRASIAEAGRAATAMESVAVGMADSVANARVLMETQRQFGKAQMRPYIALVDPSFIAQDNQRPYFAEIQLNMVNTGHTPAHNVRFYARFEVLAFPIPDNFDFAVPADGLAAGSLINPGQRLYFRRNITRLLPDTQYNRIIEGGGHEAMFIHGTIFFDDIFGDEHRTNFCSFGVWDTAGRFSIRNTPQHNDAT